MKHLYFNLPVSTNDNNIHQSWPCIIHTNFSMCFIHGIMIPMVCNHYTHVSCTSLFFPQKVGQKGVHYTQQNMVCVYIYTDWMPMVFFSYQMTVTFAFCCFVILVFSRTLIIKRLTICLFFFLLWLFLAFYVILNFKTFICC